MLGATSIGAIWSSCSPDFGINGVVDRFGQIEPKVLICADGYFYNGKQLDSLASVAGVVKLIKSIQTTVVVPFTGGDVSLPGGTGYWNDFVEVEDGIALVVVAVAPYLHARFFEEFELMTPHGLRRPQHRFRIQTDDKFSSGP